MILSLFEHSKSKSKYNLILVSIESSESSMLIQKMAFDAGFNWPANKKGLYNDIYERYGKYTLYINSDEHNLLYSIQPLSGSINYINQYNWDNKIYSSTNDLMFISNYLRFGRSTPSYKPRIIDRTMESSSTDNILPINIRCERGNSSMEMEKLFHDYGYIWYTGRKYIIRDGDYKYDARTFTDINFTKKAFSGYRIAREFSGKIYNYPEDIEIIKNLLILGRSTPSYKPRKIDRSIDSVYESESDKYTEVVIKCSSPDELKLVQEKLFKIGYTWPDYGRVIKYSYDYPAYVFAKKNKRGLYISVTTDIYRDIKEYNRDEQDSNILNKILNVNEIDNINMFFRIGINIPSYKPRIIDRTTENINESTLNKYTEVVIKCSNPEESRIAQEKLFKLGYNWFNGNSSVLFQHFKDPIYLFADASAKRITSYTFDDIQKYIEAFNRRNHPNRIILDKILNINDIDNIDMFFRLGNSIPSYRPRKIDRN